MTVHFLVPAGFAERPSGGNVYDRRVQAGLVGLGRDVVTHEVGSERDVAAVAPRVPDSAVVLVDSLVASWAADVLLAEAARLRLVALVHMAFESPGERELLAACSALVTTSAWSRRWLVEHHRLDAARIHVATPGVDMADPAPGTEAGSELLCVASLVAAKGHDVLLAALGTIADLDWRCTLVGRLDLDPDFVDELHKATADTGIADRVVFAGALPHDDVQAAYARADVLVLPSRGESYGMVVTEALAHGLPVVASSVGGVPEALGHGEDGSTPGMLVRPDDAAALAGGLRRWLEGPRRRRRLRRSAGLRRLTLTSWSRTTAQVAGALEAVR
jgi:glycosyltransferase involved in cell wall biosynthesis